MIASPLLLWLAAAPPAAGACDVEGRVLDDAERPVVGVHVSLDDGKAPRHALTDDAGGFRFPTVAAPTTVTATLEDHATAPRFVIVSGGAPVTLHAELDPARGCQITLQPEPETTAADHVALFEGLQRGFTLFDQLRIPPAATLRVEVDDPVASADAAYWVGPPSYNPEDTTPPRIVLGTAATRRDDPGAPDNREYHELGHHALFSAFGALPRSRDNIDGGGYYHNPSSADAWTEGFSIAFAALIGREVEGRSDAGRYRVAGARLDLELDYQPWDLRGLESVAVAGVLWDLLDGAQAAVASPLEVQAPAVLHDAGVPHLLVGRVHNGDDAAATDTRVQVTGEGLDAVVPVAPRSIEPGGDGWFALVLPPSIGEADDPLAGLELRAVQVAAHADDDPLQVEPAALWAAIVEHRSERPQSGGRLFDVADLHHALRGRFGASVDEVFVRHGLFADTDGNRERGPSEAIGLSSHPARTLEVDGASETWPAIDPRHRLDPPPALAATLSIEPAEAEVVVLVSGSAWGGYVAEPDAEGHVWLLPPPAREQAALTVVALAPGRRPTVLLHREATALLAEIETHDRPTLRLEAELPPFDADAAAAGIPPWTRLAFIGGAIAAVLGLLLMIVGWPRLR